ncbi:unnamed protein product [Victoria cruziana]
MEKPKSEILSKSDAIDHFVRVLSEVVGSERGAQMCIYDVLWDNHFGFRCRINEEESRMLAGLSSVLSVRQDSDVEHSNKDCGSNQQRIAWSPGFTSFTDRDNQRNGISHYLFGSNTKHWIVQMAKPGVAVVTRSQMVDYYAQTLSMVLGNEQDAQMCIYHISWQNKFGFCCELDEDTARDLAGVSGVLSVQLDANCESENKDYGGLDTVQKTNLIEPTPMRTKRLFVTGLSFYTSEKTLRAAFEGFGELVEVKVIMDKISKRSKGYGFIEYASEEAAAAALEEMNGKIINGWMIVVDVAKANPPKYGRDSSIMK